MISKWWSWLYLPPRQRSEDRLRNDVVFAITLLEQVLAAAHCIDINSGIDGFVWYIDPTLMRGTCLRVPISAAVTTFSPEWGARRSSIHFQRLACPCSRHGGNRQLHAVAPDENRTLARHGLEATWRAKVDGALSKIRESPAH